MKSIETFHSTWMQRYAIALVAAVCVMPNLSRAAPKPLAQAPVWAPPAPSADFLDPGERFKLVLKIGDAEANALRRDGVLRTKLPPAYRNRVGSIVLKGPTTFREERLKIEEDVDKLGNNLIVNVDESIVDRLGYQPVVMKIYQSNYDTVVLRYQRGPQNRLASNRKFLKPAFDDSPQLFIRMSAETGTTGWIRGMKTLPLQTQFGKMNFRFEDIRGVRFNAGQPDQVVVISATGDYLTATIDLDKITLATRWGEEEIAISDLESISWHRDSKFTEITNEAAPSPTGSGPRWLLSPVPRFNPVPWYGYYRP